MKRAQAQSSGAIEHRRSGAFTLIEVLVVVAIIALLVAILLPSLVRARAQGRQTQCTSNVHNQALALFAYAADYRGALPPNATQGLYRSSPPYYYVDTVVRLDINYDQRKLFKNYVGKQMNIFTCPAMGGPNIDAPQVESYVKANGYMLGHYDHFYNSTCVFRGSSLATPWAPNTEWMVGGPPSVVPVVQDEYTAGNATGGSTLDDPTTIYSFAHGPGEARSNYTYYSPFGNWRQSHDRAACYGINIGYLDGHAQWTKNIRLGGNNRWSLDMPWSKASTRPLSGPSENPIQGGGAILSVRAEFRR